MSRSFEFFLMKKREIFSVESFAANSCAFESCWRSVKITPKLREAPIFSRGAFLTSGKVFIAAEEKNHEMAHILKLKATPAEKKSKT